ncbi:unnamed protein product, partial [Rotaria sordida]
SMTWINNCSQYHKTCVLMTTTDFIQIMPNIRYVHLIVNNINIDKLLDINNWKELHSLITKEQVIKMVNDVDVSGDDDDGSDISNYDIDLIDHSPFPNDCQNEVQGIEFLCQYFMHRYNACPTFLIGSLEEACQEAFSSIIIKERRPVLVYIHHDKNLLTNRFCWNILCSEMIIDYLLENYIVWPWDITFESNRNILIKIWNKIFPSQTSIDFSLEQCPMLIGIMRESLYKKDSSSTSEYEFTVLFKNETLTSTEETFSLKSILNELSIFKEECDDNEQALSFDLIQKTNLSWEVIIEICKYLSLNDAINAFSSNILFFLLIGGILDDDEIQEKVRKLQLEFYCIRPAIKFQIVYM